MDNENKWEYDYSSEHSQTGETGYPNVGSSGMNTANTAGTYGEAAQAAPQAEPNSGSDGGAVPPPEGPGIRPHREAPSSLPKSAAGKMAISPAVQLRWCWPQPWALSAALWEPRWATQAAR